MSYTRDDRNEPAFPCAEGPMGEDGRTAYAPAFGITIREHFTLELLAALVQRIPADCHWDPKMVASDSMTLADAALAALGRGVVQIEDIPF